MWRTGLASGTELDCDRLKEGGMLNFFKNFKQGQRSACIKLHHKQFVYYKFII